MKLFLGVLLLFPASVWAEDWLALRDDAAITAALSGRSVAYDAYTLQNFGAGGDTQYITERMSDGRWAARGGQYCSVWPPSDVWTCYDFEVSGDQVRFIGADRTVSEGRYAD